ncbi:PREDICTED: uncharacterized protein LOC102868438 [Elephantulus edwardii]|uniref:uncharacterized protein LOC102868438 n=1 Tax=Elephantulus edwardii TaxID=28737 RepID=UPI0003F09B83|nr:PREDICTED: uncharacterized protein LOC102868438 [Elephantulus edwardii]
MSDRENIKLLEVRLQTSDSKLKTLNSRTFNRFFLIQVTGGTLLKCILYIEGRRDNLRRESNQNYPVQSPAKLNSEPILQAPATRVRDLLSNALTEAGEKNGGSNTARDSEMREFTRRLFRGRPDLSALTHSIVRQRFLAHVGRGDDRGARGRGLSKKVKRAPASPSSDSERKRPRFNSESELSSAASSSDSFNSPAAQPRRVQSKHQRNQQTRAGMKRRRRGTRLQRWGQRREWTRAVRRKRRQALPERSGRKELASHICGQSRTYRIQYEGKGKLSYIKTKDYFRPSSNTPGILRHRLVPGDRTRVT